MNDRTRNILAAGLLVVGLGQMAGDVLRVDALKGIAAATAASPAPKVFSVARGLETFSTRFFLEWRDTAGTWHTMELTPEVYGRMRGPYKRRNVYGAVLAYGPVLPAELRDPVASYALSPPDGPLLRELGIDPAHVTAVRVRYEPLPSTLADVPRELVVPPPIKDHVETDGQARASAPAVVAWASRPSDCGGQPLRGSARARRPSHQKHARSTGGGA